MTHTEAERKGMVRALTLLAAGANGGFEYELWVVFGDRRTAARSWMAGKGAIRSAGQGEWVMTESGEALRRSLEEQAQSGPISGGEPGRDAPRAARAGRPRAAVEGSSIV